ncbi:hypothetical protein [Zavarzinia sp.]|uniref:hypothetical protein n=1 Tax=Zavarzinia sp. TaxID=2027920 RepID=UPI00356A9D2A
MSKVVRLVSLGAALLLGACAANGPISSNLGRLASWFPYLSGDDIKKACAAGGPDRIRFVYNAIWTEQVRAYELKYTSYGAQVDQWVWGPGTLLAFGPEGNNLEATKASIGIDKRRLAALEKAMAESDVAGPAPKGEFLRSDNFYWVVSICRAGVFHFNAFQAPDARFAKASFPEQLFEADRTGVAINRPRRLDLDPLFGGPHPDDSLQPFTVQVDTNGLDVARFE